MRQVVVLSAFLAFTLACTSKSKKDDAPPASPNTNSGDQSSGGDDASAGGDTAGGAVGNGTCRLAVDVAQALPELPAATGNFVGSTSSIFTKQKAIHRGRDVVAVDGEPIILQAKFAYGLTDKDLEEETVDIYLSQDGSAAWQKIGSVKTTKDDEHPPVEGVEDSGGRIYADLASFNVKLPVGRHRVLLVVPADNSQAEMYVDVLPKTAKIVLTDIDGTLTSSEFSAATEIISVHPEAQPGAADMMRSFYHRGYNIFYLTARPEWLMSNTRDWLNIRGFPPGTIHTSPFTTGAQGDAAAKFKSDELGFLKANTGIVPSYAFGNKPSDVKAFGAAGIEPKNSYYFKLGEDAGGGTDHSSYRDLVPMAQAAPSACP